MPLSELRVGVTLLQGTKRPKLISFKVFSQLILPVLLMIFPLVLHVQIVLFVRNVSGFIPGDLLPSLFGLTYVLSKTPAIYFDEIQVFLSWRKGKPLI